MWKKINNRQECFWFPDPHREKTRAQFRLLTFYLWLKCATVGWWREMWWIIVTSTLQRASPTIQWKAVTMQCRTRRHASLSASHCCWPQLFTHPLASQPASTRTSMTSLRSKCRETSSLFTGVSWLPSKHKRSLTSKRTCTHGIQCQLPWQHCKKLLFGFS